MPTKTIYIPEDDIAAWDEAADLARKGKMSLSKLLTLQLKTLIKERSGLTGIPLDWDMPDSMRDPKVLARKEAAERIRLLVLEELDAAAES